MARPVAPSALSLTLSALALSVALTVPTGCGSAVGEQPEQQLTGSNEEDAPIKSGAYPVGTVLVTTVNLNLRKGPSKSSGVLHVIPEGAEVTLLKENSTSGYFKVEHNGISGYAYGAYLEATQAQPPSDDSSDGGDTGGGASSDPPPAPASSGTDVASIMKRSKAVVGFSYWWGGARLKDSGPGNDPGSCPKVYTHSGSYGADCSGFVAKAWRVPSNNAMDVDMHPYSTADFVEDKPGSWHTVSRGSVQQGDALVYRSGGSGHVFIYESGDGWGSMMVYECRGCDYGCVHRSRTAGSEYHAIRRD